MYESKCDSNIAIEATGADPFIRLSGGQKFYLNAPLRNKPDLRSLVYALAHLNRFTGHGGNYTVLHHSRAMWIAAPNCGVDPIAALFHDITEGVMGDVSSPLKGLLPDYRELYNEHESHLRKLYDLPPFDDPNLKALDALIGDVEGEMLLPGWGRLPQGNKDYEALRIVLKKCIDRVLVYESDPDILTYRVMKEYENYIGKKL